MSWIKRKDGQMFKVVTALGLTVALAGCAKEAGYQVDGGAFGNATMNNTLVMNGEQDYAISLANRFAEEVPSTVNFEFDSTVLDAQARAVLDIQANWIKQFPEVRFRVYGHTDAVGSAAYNKRLGQRRANAVVRYLSSKGISRSRLEAVASFGETQPLVISQGRERQNRRTVTEVSGFLKRHPTILDGKYAQVVYREYIASAVPATSLAESTGTGTIAN
jgi:peptidoglycan-associated lipoprotein